MAFNLFNLTGTVSANVTPFTQSLASARSSLAGFASFAARTAANISRSFTRMAGNIANGLRAASGDGRGIFGALSVDALSAGFFSAIRKAVAGASDLYETMQKVGVVFGNSTSIVVGGADEMGRKFGVVKTEFLDAASNLGLVGKAAGMTQGEAARLADGLARLALDASSFFNVPIGEALISIRAGLVGESEPLRRFGVLLSEAAVKQEALTLGLTRGKGELSESAKVRARASIITRQLADAQGDLERTSGGFANQQRKLNGLFTNFLTSVGTKILPIFQAWVNGMTELLGQFSEFFEKNSGFVAEWSQKVASYISLVGLAWRKFGDFKALGVLAIQEKILQGYTILDRTGIAIWKNLKYGASTALTVMQNAFSGLARYLETLFASIGQSLAGALVAGIADFINNPIVDAIGKLPMFAGQVGALKGIAAATKVGIPPVHGDASGLTRAAIMRGVGGAPGGFGTILKDLPNFGKEISDLVQGLHNVRIADLFEQMLGRARSAIQAIPKRKLNPVEQLNADNRRLLNGRPTITAGAGDEFAQRRAATVLRLRRGRESKLNQQETRQLGDANFGKVGNLSKLGGAFAENIVGKLTGNPKLGEIAKGVAAFVIGGPAGLVASRQGPGSRRRRGIPGMAGIGGPGETQKEFKSEFVGLSDLSKRISTDSLSKSGKDPQLNALQNIANVLGASQYKTSIAESLDMIAKKPSGPGFAT